MQVKEFNSNMELTLIFCLILWKANNIFYDDNILVHFPSEDH